ncbi:MAG: 16S rRNA (guanine(527)-N(7))-methyltransferase RsmG [Acholeplasmataceae bacterium]
MMQLKTLSPVEINDDNLKLFQTLYQKMLDYNSHTNLTSITEEVDVIVKHFIDSFWILKYVSLDDNLNMLDIGTGPGYPGLPLKILRPNLNISLLDSNLKKIQYLKHVTEMLQLNNVICIHNRAEHHALSHLNHYDVIVSRATANMATLLELSIPMLKEGGYLYLYVTPHQITSENIMNALKILKTTTYKRYDCDLPLNYGKRSIMVFKKQKHVMGYPRAYATILKKGL